MPKAKLATGSNPLWLLDMIHAAEQAKQTPRDAFVVSVILGGLAREARVESGRDHLEQATHFDTPIPVIRMVEIGACVNVFEQERDNYINKLFAHHVRKQPRTVPTEKARKNRARERKRR